MGETTISWCDKVWNVTRGCRRVSPGCERCYAERQANRFRGPGKAYEGLIKLVGGKPRWSGETRFAAEHLADPLRWRKPCRIFVDSMSDLFYEGFTNEQIAAVFGVMAAAHRHTFQILTKRARRMREWFEWADQQGDQLDVCGRHAIQYQDVGDLMPWLQPVRWPLDHVWIGVSVEDQERADERIPELLRTPAAVRFLSCEPLLGPVMLQGDEAAPAMYSRAYLRGIAGDARVNWIIAGCESGPGARPCEVDWLRSLRDQCAAAGTAFHNKQMVVDGRLCKDASKFPPDLRLQEFPR